MKRIVLHITVTNSLYYNYESTSMSEPDSTSDWWAQQEDWGGI